MAQVTASVKKIGTRTWRYYDFAGTGPWEVVRDGQVIRASSLNDSIDVDGDDTEEPPVLEIMDSGGGTAPSQAHPPYVDLQWRGTAGLSLYKVQRYDGADWVDVENGEIPEVGTGYYGWSGTAQEDGTTAQYRVLAYDSEGNASPVVNATMTVIRVPAAPRVEHSYAAGTLTISPRA